MTREYMDVIIRTIINQVELQDVCNNQNIYDGIIIYGKCYEFQETAFFEDRLRIHIPTIFNDLPDELARIKYPGDLPQIIKTDETGSINITLKLTPNTIKDEHVPMVAEGMKNILKRLNPSLLFFEEGIETIEEKTISYFDFKSPTIGEPLYNFIFIMELDQDVLIGHFNCIYGDHQAWRPVACQIMQSVRVEPKDKGVDQQFSGRGK